MKNLCEPKICVNLSIILDGDYDYRKTTSLLNHHTVFHSVEREKDYIKLKVLLCFLTTTINKSLNTRLNYRW